MSNANFGEENSDAHGRAEDQVVFEEQDQYLKVEVYRVGSLPMPRVRILDLTRSPARRMLDIDIFQTAAILEILLKAAGEYLIALTSGHTEEG